MTRHDLDPTDIARWMAERSVVLIDVREPAEFAVERIHGALLFPLSTFDPQSLPRGGAREIVFHCGTGLRSAKALDACADAGLAVTGHMKGGLRAWKSAGLPIISTDPATGRVGEK